MAEARRFYRAWTLANWAHHEQEYRPGHSYFWTHVANVWWRVRSEDADDDTQVVALLHDVVEDTSIPLSVIRAEFGDKIADEVSLLTREHDQSYEEYINNIWGWGTMARTVKIADLEANLEALDHPECPPEKQKNRERYEKALAFLKENEYGDPPTDN